jgi:hypothetical protein
MNDLVEEYDYLAVPFRPIKLRLQPLGTDTCSEIIYEIIMGGGIAFPTIAT